MSFDLVFDLTAGVYFNFSKKPTAATSSPFSFFWQTAPQVNLAHE